MLDLMKYLRAIEELHKLSPDAAKRFEFYRSGGSDDITSITIKRVCDPSKRFRVCRDVETSDTSGTIWLSKTYLEVDNTEIDAGALDIDTREKLEAKLETAFKPLFETLEAERVASPLRKEAEQAAQAAATAAKQREHSAQVSRLLDSL